MTALPLLIARIDPAGLSASRDSCQDTLWKAGSIHRLVCDFSGRGSSRADTGVLKLSLHTLFHFKHVPPMAALGCTRPCSLSPVASGALAPAGEATTSLPPGQAWARALQDAACGPHVGGHRQRRSSFISDSTGWKAFWVLSAIGARPVNAAVGSRRPGSVTGAGPTSPPVLATPVLFFFLQEGSASSSSATRTHHRSSQSAPTVPPAALTALSSFRRGKLLAGCGL